jgi:hypothetical protein
MDPNLQPIATGRNARVGQIRKFVCVPPERGQVLRLVTIEDHPAVLGEWPRLACVDNGHTADDVDMLLREHANTIGQEAMATLAWTAEGGFIVCQKRLRCRPDASQDGPMDPAWVAQAEALGINGTREGRELQSQRATEAMIRLYMSGHQQLAVERNQLNRHSLEMVSMLGGLLKESWAANHAAQLELDRVRAAQRLELDKWADELRAREESPESIAKAAQNEVIEMAVDLLKPVAPVLAQALLQKFVINDGAAPVVQSAPPPAAA